MEYIRRNIEAEMVRKNLHQRDMAKRLHREERTWRRWMKDPECISLGMLQCIANILDTTVQDLLTERGQQ